MTVYVSKEKYFTLNSLDYFFFQAVLNSRCSVQARGKDLMTLLNLKLSEDQPFPRPHRWHGYYPNLKILAKRNVVIGSLLPFVCLVRQLPIVNPAERRKPRKPKR